MLKLSKGGYRQPREMGTDSKFDCLKRVGVRQSY